MNILDENIVDSQRRALQRRPLRFRRIGYEVGWQGMKDREIIAMLTGLQRPTLFTRDLGLYRRELCHARYRIVVMAVEKHRAEDMIVRFLRHREFDTRAKRMGKVMQLSDRGLRAWATGADKERVMAWRH